MRWRHSKIAHNALLIDGQGQPNRDDTASGELIAFRTLPHLAYVAGDAHRCYSEPLQKYVRHIVLLRPFVVIIVDELEAERPIDITWLMHTKEELLLRPQSQSFTVRRDKVRMAVHLASSAAPLDFSQTDEWPIPPKLGYPMVKVPDPPPQWHFQAKTMKSRAMHRVVAVMAVGDQ